MAITLISTPAHVKQVSPPIISRWLATESENNFRLFRHDFDIVTAVNNAGFLQLTVAAGTYSGTTGDIVSVFNKTLNAMYVGTATAGTGTTTINTDIPYLAGFAPGDTALDPDRTITYLNDHTLYGGYYFEGRLTINGVLEALTVVASPDSFGYANLDVSGVLRIKTSLAKTGNYTAPIMAEPTKSGNFSFEYRSCWYGSSELWIPEGGVISPPSDTITWYYIEAVRSEEQGSNLHEYIANAIYNAPFLNSFERPVYFVGLPFDISFIFPETVPVSPASDVTVTMKIFNSLNTQLGVDVVTIVPADTLEGFINSLMINPASIPDTADHLTLSISV
jgi:hypothetical protein